MTQTQPTDFSSLPTELRLQIWRTFLKAEPDRLVVIDFVDGSIYPTNLLVSPLLSVNSESREIAKAFYNFVVDVHHIAFPDYYPWIVYGRRRKDYQECPLGRFAGKVHLNLDHDIFVDGPLFNPVREPAPLFNSFKTKFYFETKPISREDCNRVQSLCSRVDPILCPGGYIWTPPKYW
ncbi:hypothetical protein F4805DRAFT_313347 [Annulohypoxylon moriforme]|nr:hypothetical protein F4805DRAFT_313347 [Annulohypoxylon moriforme]